MKGSLLFVLPSVIFLFAAGLLVSCDGLDDMTTDYRDYCEEIIERRRQDAEADLPEYEPGEYWLAALLDDNYDVKYNAVSARIQARESYTHYEWWLYKSTGALVAWSSYNDGNELEDYGGVMGLGNSLLLSTEITRVATTKGAAKDTDEDDDVSHKSGNTNPVQSGNNVAEFGDAPYIVKCQAKNSLGDLYWDTATLYVIVPDEDESEGEAE